VSRLYKIYIVIDENERDSSNEFCNSIGAEGETFTVALFDSNNQIAGYWCGWLVVDEQLKEIRLHFDKVFETAEEALKYTGWHPASTPDEIAKQQLILQVTQSESLE
jgi:hypothetical protein